MTDSVSFNKPEASDEDLGNLLLEVLPPDCSMMGNLLIQEALSRVAERQISKREYETVRDKALTLGLVVRGRGRGGSIALAEGIKGGGRYEVTSEPTPRHTSQGKGAVTEPAFKIGQKLTLSQLESFIWKSTDILRGSMDSSEFADYILGILFFKSLSDAFDEAKDGVIRYYLNKGRTQEEAEALAEDVAEYDMTFYVPAIARWENIRDIKHDIGTALNKATAAIEEQNPALAGVLTAIDFNIKNKLGDTSLGDLLCHYSQFRLRIEDFEHPELLGAASELMIKRFADSAGKRGGEFYTPETVVQLLVALIKPHAGMKVLDPTCGSGGMLIQSSNFLAKHGECTQNISLFGQECNLRSWVICKLNMFLHGFFNADIRMGDSLSEPQHVENDELMRFDRVIANPPFGLSNWDYADRGNDLFGRYKYGIPPRNSGDLAFVQHMIASLNQSGSMGVVVTHGVLSRGGQEGEIRKGIIEDDLVEAVIGLPPRLFYGTGIPVALLIINKSKQAERKGKVLFIDAGHEFEEKNRIYNCLGEDSISKILNCFDTFEEIEDYSRIVTKEQIAHDDNILRIKQYVNASPEAAQIKRLLKQYGDYKLSSLADLAVEVKLAKHGNSYVETDNALYVPRDGTRNVTHDLAELGTSHHNAIQIILDKRQALSRYVSLFLQSELGRLMLSSLRAATITGGLSQSSLFELNIAIPEIYMQSKMIEASNRLEALKASIRELEKEMVFSPHSTNTVLDQVDGMLEVVGGLSEADRVMSLIRQGESASVEFKESFSLDVRKGTSERYIELSCLKTIAAFMNTEGGFLLVGVDDEGATIGLGREINDFHNGKKDRFLLHFKNHIKSRIGEEFYPYINQKFISVGGKDILLVDCKRSSTECFLDGKDFYVRTNPATDKLEGQKLLDYIRNHFTS